MCDGGLKMRPLHSTSQHPVNHQVGSTVHFCLPNSETAPVVASGMVLAMPIARHQAFCVTQLSDGAAINLDQTKTLDSASAMGGLEEDFDSSQGDPLQDPLQRQQPTWLHPDSRVVLEHHGQRSCGFLLQDECGDWTFEQRDLHGMCFDTTRQSERGATWRELETEGLLEMG